MMMIVGTTVDRQSVVRCVIHELNEPFFAMIVLMMSAL